MSLYGISRETYLAEAHGQNLLYIKDIMTNLENS